MSKPLLLVDGSSYFFRAFHALPPLTNSKGQPTGAIYGVANMVKRLIKDYQPVQMAVVFDAKGKTFRDDWYPEYKANRHAMPSDLLSQFQPLISLLKAMGLPLLIIDGVEADDVIGTLARQATEKKQSVIVSTSDKDMAQLVNEHVTLINTMSNQILDRAGVKTKFGVWPEQMIDYLTLVGDTTDNIPGVNKCGPKTAAKWLEEYQTLDNLLANSAAITGKIGECLQDSLGHLPLSKKLVTIRTDIDLPYSLDELSIKPMARDELVTLVRELEFKNWLKDLLNDETATDEPASSTLQHTIEIITEKSQLDQLLTKLQFSPTICVSTETNHIDPICADIVGITFALAADAAAYIPLTHKDGGQQLEREEVLSILTPLLENPNLRKIGHNLKSDYTVLKNHGIKLQGIFCDTMLESYVLNSTAARHDIDSLALKYLGHKPITMAEVVGTGAKQICFDQVPVQKASAYAGENAVVMWNLHQTLYPMMDDKLKQVFHDIEMPLLTVIAEIEYHGVLIDETALGTHGVRLKAKMKQLEDEAFQLTGKAFNLNSPKQLQDILFGEQKLPIISKTPTGQPSTAESVLQELAYEYRLPAIILEYRSLCKLVTTYIDVLPKRINAKSHRVHTSYNQAIAATGRLSSSEPNLQNIPIRNEEGRLIRKAFIAPPHHLLMAADYSQIELRIMAHLSHDANLLNAFAKGWDIHTATASEIFSTPLLEVSHEQRRRAKAVNFGLIYGMSSFGLAKQLGVERQDAQNYIDLYFQRYPGVLEYMERTRKQAHQLGYVETVFNRRLYLPEINTRNLMRQKAAERMAINAPMQGTAADIIKKAMLAIAQWQNSQVQPKAQMIMQVHDELVFEVHEDALEEVQHCIKDLMQNTVQLSVPLEVTVGRGKNWDEAH
jgi:DNA polymerase-1